MVKRGVKVQLFALRSPVNLGQPRGGGAGRVVSAIVICYCRNMALKTKILVAAILPKVWRCSRSCF